MAVTVGMSTLTGVAAAQRDTVAGPANRALIDVEHTTEVLDRAKSVSEELFTFTYTDIQAHRKRFAELTMGEFSRQYDDLFETVVAQATAQQLSLSSTVQDAAVRVLEKDEAEVLVFVNQTSTNGVTGGQVQSNTMFLATLQRSDGDWKIADLDLFEDQ